MLEYDHPGDTAIAVALVNALNDNSDLHALAIKILLFVYLPRNQHLTTREMASRFGVSNPGVRKALKTLLTKGLVQYEKERIKPSNLNRYLQVS